MHAVTFHAVETQMKYIHKQGVGERSEPHSLYIYMHVSNCYSYRDISDTHTLTVLLFTTHHIISMFVCVRACVCVCVCVTEGHRK